MSRERRANQPGKPATDYSDAELRTVQSLRAQGYSLAEIGERLGLSRGKVRHRLAVAVRKLCEPTPGAAGAEHPESAEDGSSPAPQATTDPVSMIAAGIDRIGRRLDRAEALLASAQARVDRAAATDAALARLDEQLARAQAGLDGYAARLHRRDALQMSVGDGLARQTEALAETRHRLERHNTLLRSALDALAKLPAKGAAA